MTDDKRAILVKEASLKLGASSITERNNCLKALSALLQERKDEIFKENKNELKS